MKKVFTEAKPVEMSTPNQDAIKKLFNDKQNSSPVLEKTVLQNAFAADEEETTTTSTVASIFGPEMAEKSFSHYTTPKKNPFENSQIVSFFSIDLVWFFIRTGTRQLLASMSQ